MRQIDRRHRHTTPTSARRWLAATRLAGLTLLGIAACSPDRASAPPEPAPHRPFADIATPATEQLLYQQLPVAGSNLFATHSFESVADFTVPPGGRWHVTRVVLVGGAHTESFYFNVYPDDGGQPGMGIVISAGGGMPAGTANPCCGGDVFDYDYRISFTVDPGTYWISTRNPFRPQLATQQAQPAMVGMWNTGVWSPAPLVAPDTDFAFSIYGTLETPSAATTDLGTMIEGFGLDHGTLNSFQVKLRAALDALAANDAAGACRALQDLINAVSAQSGKKLTVAQADAVIAEATRIRLMIGC